MNPLMSLIRLLNRKRLFRDECQNGEKRSNQYVNQPRL